MFARFLVLVVLPTGLTAASVWLWWRYQRLDLRTRRKIAPGLSRGDQLLRNPWIFLICAAGALIAAITGLIDFVSR